MLSTRLASRSIPASASTAAATIEPAEAGRSGREALRIVMVCARYHPLTGGIETHVHETARRLADRACTVDVLTTDTTGELPRQEQIDGISILRVPAWPSWSDARFAPRIFGEIVK